eukprot:782192-Prorocentrum_minimum.AAC.1
MRQLASRYLRSLAVEWHTACIYIIYPIVQRLPVLHPLPLARLRSHFSRLIANSVTFGRATRLSSIQPLVALASFSNRNSRLVRGWPVAEGLLPPPPPPPTSPLFKRSLLSEDEDGVQSAEAEPAGNGPGGRKLLRSATRTGTTTVTVTVTLTCGVLVVTL